jgi:hypothetical protein
MQPSTVFSLALLAVFVVSEVELIEPVLLWLEVPIDPVELPVS